jgi:hypothetical protein
MKTLSLRLNDAIFEETENVVLRLRKPRNKYINEAIEYYNKVQNQTLLAKQLEYESNLVATESMNVLSDFEAIYDNNQEI